MLFPDYIYHESGKQYWVNIITHAKYFPSHIMSNKGFRLWGSCENYGPVKSLVFLGAEEINTLENWRREGKWQPYCRHLYSVRVSSKQSISKLWLSSIKNILVIKFNVYKPFPCVTMIFYFFCQSRAKKRSKWK